MVRAKGVFVLSDYSYINLSGATAVRVALFAKGLTKQNYNVKYIIPFKRDLASLEEPRLNEIDGLFCHYVVNNKFIPTNSLKKILYRIVSIVKTMKMIVDHRKYYDRKFIFSISPIFWYTYPIALLGKHFGYKIIFEYNDLPLIEYGEGSILHPVKRIFYRLGEHINYTYGPRNLAGIVTITQQLNSYFEDNFPSIPKMVIPLNADYDRIRMGNIIDGKRPKHMTLVYSGSYFEFEGVNELIDAFKIVEIEHSNVQLILTGDLPYQGWEKTKSYTRSLGFKAPIIFTGMLPYEDYIQTIRDAYILLLPKNENVINNSNFPTKLGEYMATGNPVVAGQSPVLDDFLTNNENVVFYKPGDVEEFASRISYLLSHPEERLRIGRNARDFAQNQFDYQHNAKQLDSFMNTLYS